MFRIWNFWSQATLLQLEQKLEFSCCNIRRPLRAVCLTVMGKLHQPPGRAAQREEPQPDASEQRGCR